MTILRAFVIADRPGSRDYRWGSFEAWAALIPPAIVFAGGANVLEARVKDSPENDPITAALGALLTHMPRLANESTNLRARDIIHALYAKDEHPHHAPAPPDGYDDLRDAIELLTRTPSGKTPGTRQLGDAFRRMRGRWVNGRRLMSEIDQHAKVVRWYVEQRAPAS